MYYNEMGVKIGYVDDKAGRSMKKKEQSKC
jgi:hypothetical protein